METVLVDNFGTEEAQILISLLKNEGIFAYRKESGLGNISRIKFGHNSVNRHVIIINTEDEPIALKILNKYRSDRARIQKETEMVCSKCGQKEPIVIYKELNFWQKIIYAGTKPKKCTNCQNEWL